MGNTFANLHTRFFGNEEIKMLLAGVSGAGLTTILYKLKFNEVLVTIHSNNFIVETIAYKNYKLTIWEMGGGYRFRHTMWTHYSPSQKGFIFVVDSNNRECMPLVKEELNRWMFIDECARTPLLIFANKQDLPNAMSVAEITEILEVEKPGTIRNPNWHIVSASAMTGEGLHEGLDWLTKQIRMANK